ncbi:LysR family transcriptional regulator [Luteolibacter algae]|uniref:LysR family transcriptional regulator n=1 Tax=Luteolibacter algae TaxID=454151 RepID=A0ABW5D954_9BACT
MRISHRSTFKLETDLNSLRALVAVVEEGGFTAAGGRVNRTQSAISLQIAKLEERLGVQLLERTSRTVAITSAGEIFVSYARRMLELADEAMLAVSSPDEATSLRVGFAEYLVPQHLHSLLVRFRRAHPQCELKLVLGVGPEMLEAMDRGELDLVLTGPEWKGGNPLWEEPLVWTGTRDDSGDLELVLMHAPCSFRQIAFDALAKAGISWKVSIDANSVHTVQSAIRAGVGASVLPLSAILKDMPLLEGDLPKLPNTSVNSYLAPDCSNPYAQRLVNYLLAGLDESLPVHRLPAAPALI